MASQTDELTSLFGWDTFITDGGGNKKFNKILREWLKRASAHQKKELKRQEDLSKTKDDDDTPSEKDPSDSNDSEDDGTLKRKLRNERRQMGRLDESIPLPLLPLRTLIRRQIRILKNMNQLML
jgi:hypothetical protein